MSTRPGTLYAVGLGPGAADLMTVRAQTILRRVLTICAPVRRAGGQSYALQIAGDILDPSRQRVVTLAFPEGAAGWADHVERIVDFLANGDVAFVTEGDPLLYSTFIGVLQALRDKHPDVQVSIVPGVASPLAAAAAAAVPLVDDDQRLAILPALYAVDELAETLRHFDTVVLLKVSGVLDRVLDCLEQTQYTGSVLHIRRVGRPEQTIVSDVPRIRAAPEDIRTDYLSLLILTRPTGDNQ